MRPIMAVTCMMFLSITVLDIQENYEPTLKQEHAANRLINDLQLNV
jgi:hypothetical protein